MTPAGEEPGARPEAARARPAPDPEAARRLPGWLAALVVVLLGAAAYSNSLDGVFVYDDHVNLRLNPYLRDPWSPTGADGRGWGWAIREVGLCGRPVTAFTFAVNHALAGAPAEPGGAPGLAGFHLVNLGVHLLAGLALLGLVRRVLESPRLAPRWGAAARGLALAVASLWVAHPLLTAAVTYLYQRCESLMGLFYFTTLYAALRSFASPRPALWSLAAVLACALGMGSKEVMVSAPLAVLLAHRLFFAGSLGAALRARGGLYLGLAASWGLLAWIVVSSGAHATSVGYGFSQVTLWGYVKTQAVALPTYLRLALWPHPLVFDYGWPIPESASVWLPAGALVAALLAGTLLALRRQPGIAFAGALFFLVLAPTSSVLPISTELMSERRMYVPLAAVLALVVLAAWRLGLRGRVGALSTGVLALALASATFARNRDFHDERRLWDGVAELRPENPRAHNVLGDLARQRGELEGARFHYARAVSLQPDFPFWRNNLGACLAELGREGEAIEQFREALRLDPGFLQVASNLARLLYRRRDGNGAADAFARVLAQQPGNFEARRGLAASLALAGRDREAAGHLQTLIQAQPGDADAQRRLAELQVRSRDDAVRDGAAALRTAQRGLSGNRQGRLEWLLIQAAAQAELGDFDAAVETSLDAVQRANARGRADLVDEARRRVDLYRAGVRLAEDPGP